MTKPHEPFQDPAAPATPGAPTTPGAPQATPVRAAAANQPPRAEVIAAQPHGTPAAPRLRLEDRLARIWVSPPKAAALQATSQPAHPNSRWLSPGLWCVAILFILHRVLVRAVNGATTDDFTTVHSALRRFLDGVPVYNEVYHWVDPHYLYNPGATLLLSPLGLLPHPGPARMIFVGINALCIVIALGVLTWLSGRQLRDWVWPASVAFAFLTEAVCNTLIFSNINGVLLLVLTLFLACLLHSSTAHFPRWVGGILLGIGMLIKPIFAPLLFLPFILGHWQTILSALAVPVVLNAIAWPLVPGANDYVTKVMPYLAEVRDYANSSLAGNATYFGMPTMWRQIIWVMLALCVIIALLALARLRINEPFLWATCTAGVLFAGVFVLSSLGQMYYSIFLFPMMFTVLHPRSPFHSFLGWVAGFFYLTPMVWNNVRSPMLGRWVGYLQATFGWSLIIVVIAGSALAWVWQDHRQAQRHAQRQAQRQARTTRLQHSAH